MEETFAIPVLEGKCEVEHKLRSLTSKIQEREEFDQLLQKMAQTVIEYEERLDCSAVGVAENTGKPIEEVGQRQARRKILTHNLYEKGFFVCRIIWTYLFLRLCNCKKRYYDRP